MRIEMYNLCSDPEVCANLMSSARDAICENLDYNGNKKYDLSICVVLNEIEGIKEETNNEDQ